MLTRDLDDSGQCIFTNFEQWTTVQQDFDSGEGCACVVVQSTRELTVFGNFAVT